MPSENRPYMGRSNTPAGMPRKDDPVFDPDRQAQGIVTRRGLSATLYVKFDDSEDEVMYTYRTALRSWKAFPGPASARGLQSVSW